MSSLSARERRLIAVALLLAAMTFVAYAILGPLLSGFADRAERRAELLELYARNERALDQIAAVRADAETQRASAGRFRIDAPTPGVAADRLRERLAALVAESGGELRAVEDAAGEPGTVRVRLDARLTLGQLVTLLAGCLNNRPVMLVPVLSVTADQALSLGRLSPLDVRLEAVAATSAPQRR